MINNARLTIIVKTLSLSEADPTISIRGLFLEQKIDFQTICFMKNQKIPRRNSKRKLKKNEI